MKMILVIYGEAADYDVIAAFKDAGIKAYTKMGEVCGEGSETEPKLATHVWPGKNNALFIAIDDTEVPKVMEVIRYLKREHPRAGVKGFVFPLDEVL